MSEYAIATGAARRITIGGKDYLVGKFTPRDFGDLDEWLKEQCPDPRLKARELCHGMSDAFAVQVWRDLSEEAKHWPLTIANGGEELFYRTHEGAARLLWVRLRRHNPSVTLDVARHLALDVEDTELRQLVRSGFPEETWLPKSQTAETTESPPDTPRSEPSLPSATDGPSTSSTT